MGMTHGPCKAYLGHKNMQHTFGTPSCPQIVSRTSGAREPPFCLPSRLLRGPRYQCDAKQNDCADTDQQLYGIVMTIVVKGTRCKTKIP